MNRTFAAVFGCLLCSAALAQAIGPSGFNTGNFNTGTYGGQIGGLMRWDEYAARPRLPNPAADPARAATSGASAAEDSLRAPERALNAPISSQLSLPVNQRMDTSMGQQINALPRRE